MNHKARGAARVHRFREQSLALVLMAAALLPVAGCAAQDALGDNTAQDLQSTPLSYPPTDMSAAQAAQLTPDQLDQLAAPVALYPDNLVAQILAAATYPPEVVEADRWLQANPGLTGQALGTAVDAQAWDPSVKALVQVPAVLAMMDKNLSWTSALGDAYVNEPQAVMDAVQRLRLRAQQAGNLQSNPQQNVTTSGSDIEIEPAQADTVFVPEYDPWLVYGAPIDLYPDWYFYPGLYWTDPAIYWGLGVGVGLWAGYDWGWGHWGCDWGGRGVWFNHSPWFSRSPSFWRNPRGPGARGFGPGGRPGGGLRPGGGVAGGGYRPGPGFQPGGGFRPGGRAPAPGGARGGVFSGFGHGGTTHGYSSRGAGSIGGGFHGGGFGGGGFHGGGGGFHGGGGGRR